MNTKLYCHIIPTAAIYKTVCITIGLIDDHLMELFDVDVALLVGSSRYILNDNYVFLAYEIVCTMLGWVRVILFF
jgi:hypothetical protein